MVRFWKTGADGNSVNRDFGGQKCQDRSLANPLFGSRDHVGTLGEIYGTFNIIRCCVQGLPRRSVSNYLVERFVWEEGGKGQIF